MVETNVKTTQKVNESRKNRKKFLFFQVQKFYVENCATCLLRISLKQLHTQLILLKMSKIYLPIIFLSKPNSKKNEQKMGKKQKNQSRSIVKVKTIYQIHLCIFAMQIIFEGLEPKKENTQPRLFLQACFQSRHANFPRCSIS